jgi:transcriptional regulator of arginine metabolism
MHNLPSSTENLMLCMVSVYTDSLGRINMKSRRQSAILDVVEQEAVRSQEQLRQRLAQHGFDVTQATLSRDIKELGLVKRSSDGAYQPAGAQAAPGRTTISSLGRALTEYLLNIEPVQQLVVLKTGAGQAQLLGLAIDRARLEEVVGTLAGDDTILIIARDAKNAQQVVKKLRDLAH